MSNNKTWFHFEERGVFWGMRLILATYGLLGRAVCLFLVNVVVLYYWLSHGKARAASTAYLQRIAQHPNSTVIADRRTSLRHFMQFGAAVVDKFAAWRGDITFEHVHIPDRSPLERILDTGRGGVLIGAHLGNMDVCRAMSQMRDDIRLNVLVHTRHAEKFNRLLGEISDNVNLALIQVSELSPATAILLQQRVDAGELVVIMGDRVPLSGGQRTVPVRFLGEDAPFPQGPFILASLLKCPVLTLFCTREKNRFQIEFRPLADRIILPRRDRYTAMAGYIQDYAAQLEAQCLRYPLQWFNFYDFWHQDTL